MALSSDVDTIFRIPLTTDGPWIGTPPQSFYLMLDTGSSLSWLQTASCNVQPTRCNLSPKFDATQSSTLQDLPETITVQYTEGTIVTQMVSDRIILGSLPPKEAKAKAQWPPALMGSKRFFGVTNDIAGDEFLLTKEVYVSGFLGASRMRFESESDYTNHIFADVVNSLAEPVFSLTFTDTWGTLTLGGSDPGMFSNPLSWDSEATEDEDDRADDEDDSVRATVPTDSVDSSDIRSTNNTMGRSPGDNTPSTNISTNSTIHNSSTEEDGKHCTQSPAITHSVLDKVWFDSGTTYIWGDAASINVINQWIGADPVTGRIDCSTILDLGTIVFTVGEPVKRSADPHHGMLRIELTPSEYIVGAPTATTCYSALNANGPKKDHWIFGLHFLKGFHTVYHYRHGLIGLAPRNITSHNPSGIAAIPGSHMKLIQSINSSRLISSGTFFVE
ncbi:hypothetical protein BGZ73_000176 [Actinomortierella ambigua]|nr:hypothetical protein BGZ73_000176 [Actinomortierella ambigua]